MTLGAGKTKMVAEAKELPGSWQQEMEQFIMPACFGLAPSCSQPGEDFVCCAAW